MDSLPSLVSDYWWVIVVPAGFMLFLWLFQGRGLRWIVAASVAGLFLLHFSNGRSSSLLDASAQLVHYVADVLRQFARRLL